MTESHAGSARRRPGARTGGDPPLIAHVIHNLITGGLENGLVNLINRIPPERYRHVVVCLQRYSDFRFRISRPDVAVHALDKGVGHEWGLYLKLYRLFRRERPSIVHSRNLTGLDSMLPAFLAGVPVRVHGEHGWDVNDLRGANPRHRLLRRIHRPLIHRYVALSRDIERYLTDRVRVPPERIAQIYNGVDVDLFRPSPEGRRPLPGAGFDAPGLFVVGTVGRLMPVKDPMTLARAFVEALRQEPALRSRMRLAMIGPGDLHAETMSILRDAQAADLAWLPGEGDDIPSVMRGFDLFVLPSLAEGVSNTILEAMASGLPIVATNVGGNPELVDHGRTGTLVPAADPPAMARAIREYAADPDRCLREGREARLAAERRFSLDAMVRAYLSLYDGLCTPRGAALGEPGSRNPTETGEGRALQGGS